MAVEQNRDLETEFKLSAEWIRKSSTPKLSTDQKLSLYGFYKQASDGPCTTRKPGIFDMTGRAKWEAWHQLGTMTIEEAMKEYTNLVRNIAPHWKDTPQDGDTPPSSKGTGGPAVSTLNSAEVIPDANKNIFDWCKEGNVTRLSSMVTEANVNTMDEQGLTLLHWACDRGHLGVVKLLVSVGAKVNQQDPDLQTPLHYAASCSHEGVVKFLLTIPSINTHLCDCDGATPIEVTSDLNIRALL